MPIAQYFKSLAGMLSKPADVERERREIEENGEEKEKKWRMRGSILQRQWLASRPCLDVSRSDHLAG